MRPFPLRLAPLLFLLPVASAQTASTVAPVAPVSQTPSSRSSAPTSQAAPVPGPQLQLEPGAPLILRAGAGSAVITLTNDTAASIPLQLTAGPFVDTVTTALLTKPSATFAPISGTEALPKEIPAHQSIQVKVSVADMSASSASTLTLANSGVAIGSIHLLAMDAPLNITVAGAGTVANAIAYRFGYPSTITLKNGDAQGYTFDWTFQLEKHIQSGQATLAPNGIARISLIPGKEDYSLTDRLRPSGRSGLLILMLHGPSGVVPGLLPERPLQVNLTMQRIDPESSAFWSYLYVGFILVLGGLLSLLGNAVLPNVQKKSGLRVQLGELAERTSNVSTRVDSYLRVLLRLERKKIELLVEAATPWSFTAGDNYGQIALSIEQLDKRLTVAERLDNLRRKHEATFSTAPPSVSDSIDAKLHAGAERLHTFVLSAADLAAANAALDDAEARLNMLGDPDSLAKLVAANFALLKKRITTFTPAYLIDIQAALDGIWSIATEQFDDPSKIAPRSIFAVDHAVAAMQISMDFAMVRESLPKADSSSNSSLRCAGETARNRLIERQCKLLDLLGTLSWQGLRAATILVQEMREDIYEEDVLLELAREGQAAITFDTQTARPYLPVFFTVAFRDFRYNRAAAVDRLLCQWDFQNFPEDGWKICHFFPAQEPPRGVLPFFGNIGLRIHRFFTGKPRKIDPQWKQITATLRTCKAPPSAAAAMSPVAGPVPATVYNTPIVLTRFIELQAALPDSNASLRFAERVRFAITMGVALASLLSGALDQLGKLDFLPATVAIFVLGFGADAVKNLLTQGPTAQPPKPPTPPRPPMPPKPPIPPATPPATTPAAPVEPVTPTNPS
jgi:hypothetical protein